MRGSNPIFLKSIGCLNRRANVVHPRENDVEVVLATLLGLHDDRDVEAWITRDDGLHVVVITGDHDTNVVVGNGTLDWRFVINRFLHVLI